VPCSVEIVLAFACVAQGIGEGGDGSLRSVYLSDVLPWGIIFWQWRKERRRRRRRRRKKTKGYGLEVDVSWCSDM